MNVIPSPCLPVILSEFFQFGQRRRQLLDADAGEGHGHLLLSVDHVTFDNSADAEGGVLHAVTTLELGGGLLIRLALGGALDGGGVW